MTTLVRCQPPAPAVPLRLVAAWRRLVRRLRRAPKAVSPSGTDAEIRRHLGRDLPAHLRRDLGLDPNVL